MAAAGLQLQLNSLHEKSLTLLPATGTFFDTISGVPVAKELMVDIMPSAKLRSSGKKTYKISAKKVLIGLCGFWIRVVVMITRYLIDSGSDSLWENLSDCPTKRCLQEKRCFSLP